MTDGLGSGPATEAPAHDAESAPPSAAPLPEDGDLDAVDPQESVVAESSEDDQATDPAEATADPGAEDRASRGGRPTPGVGTSTPAPSTVGTTTPAPSAADRSAAATADRRDRIGVAIPAAYLQHEDVEEMEQRLDEVVALGAGWVRTDANWSWIESRQGAPDWSTLDDLLSAADARGLEVLLIVGRTPTWARPAGTTELHGPSTAAERAAFADFAQRMASRYAGRVGAWEVWNEPNLDQFWAPSPDPADYAALLRATYSALKSADPDTPVLIGGTGGAESGDIDTVDWYRAVYANGGGGSFDVANVHPYQDWREAAAGRGNTGEMGRVRQVREIMVSNGDAAKPMWGTEFGAPTSGSTATTEDGQRVVYTEGRDLWFSLESGPLFLYYLRDREAYGASSSRSSYWGLMRFDGTPKPAYDALAAWIAAA